MIAQGYLFGILLSPRRMNNMQLHDLCVSSDLNYVYKDDKKYVISNWSMNNFNNNTITVWI